MGHDHHDDRGGDIIDDKPTFDDYIRFCINDVIRGADIIDDRAAYDNCRAHHFLIEYNHVDHPDRDYYYCPACNNSHPIHDGPDDDGGGQSDPPGEPDE